jgi:phosphoserine phosphatase
LAESRLGFVPRTVVFDADSTLVGIEGIDWLAGLRPPEVAAQIARRTEEAMSGALPLERVYGERLAAVAPTADELEQLGRAYVAATAPGARECVASLHGAGVRVLIVSGGLRPPLLALATYLGVAAVDVHGVEVSHAADGAYTGFDTASLLAQQHGKAALVKLLERSHGVARPLVAVGDGSTDAAMRTAGVADAFVAYTGFVTRESVVRTADFTCDSFERMLALLLPRP